MKEIANNFVTWAICEWGQDDNVRIEAVQKVIDARGLDATATCFPVFGGIWPKKCEGKDAEEATNFLQKITDTMKRGKFEEEVEHVVSLINT